MHKLFLPILFTLLTCISCSTKDTSRADLDYLRGRTSSKSVFWDKGSIKEHLYYLFKPESDFENADDYKDFYKNVPSRFTPIGDVAVGEDVADAVWYFAAHARNTTGAELVVDGGNTIQLYPIIK